MNEELISIIVPVYKVEKYLERCINSVLNQTYTNIECIIIDDGSPDQCPEICDRYAFSDERVKVIHKKNGGLSSARNQGLDIAKGGYIAFVDSDDYIHPRMIELLYTNLKKTDADIAMCDIEYVYDNNFEKKENISPVKAEVIDRKHLLEKLLQQYAGVYVVMCNKLYRKELWNQLRFPIGVLHEDEAVIHDLFLRCNKCVSLNEKLYSYYQRSGSIMNSQKSDRDLLYYDMLADRFNKIQGIVDERYLIERIKLIWWEYMDTYYEFWNKNPKSIYLKKMKQSLWKVMPIMKEYHICSYKEHLSILIFMLSSKIYKSLFYERKGK